MPARTHLSIGEVLSLLREEFPDVTISKIRFLESQGLVDPERTPSGYRKFYEHDVDRLRWILRQQREHFLPLKVIRGRLSEGDVDGDEVLGLELGADAGPEGPGPAVPPGAGPPESAVPQPPAPEPAVPAGAGAPEPAVSRRTGPPEPAVPQPAVPAGAGIPEPAAPEAVAPAPHVAAVPPGAEVDSYTIEELASAAGVSDAAVAELREFGLLGPASGAGRGAWYDGEALEVVRLAATFARHGVEARHLRAWRTSAEREASVFEQVIMPLLRQRNPQARVQATETLDELADAGGRLRQALLARALRDLR